MGWARPRKILLIEPPFYRLFKDSYSLDRYPLSLGYLAGTVRTRTEWDVAVYNADFFPNAEAAQISHMTGAGYERYVSTLRDPTAGIWRQIEDTIRQQEPSVVGITTKTQNFHAVCNVAGIVKAIDPRILVIVGGPHPSMVRAEALRCPEIDIAVQGEAETTIVELLGSIAAGGSFDTVKGIIHRKNGTAVENPSAGFIENLDSLCFPHQFAPEVLLDYEEFPKASFQSIFATRGCPYRCTFCGSREIWSARVRYRSPASVVEEMLSLRKMGLEHVHFDDDTFGVNRKYIHELCGLIRERCRGMTWSCEIHVNLVSDETIAIMKRAGCTLVQIGVESGSDQVLATIRKGFTVEKALRAAEMINRHGLILQTFFMVGFPTETEATLRDTIETMRRIKTDQIIYSIFTPYPGTDMFRECEESGLIPPDYDPALYNHQSAANCFCKGMTRERFRAIASEVEVMVDEMNRLATSGEWMLRKRVRAFNLTFDRPVDIYLFGTGSCSDDVWALLDHERLRVAGYFDNDERKIGLRKNGKPIEKPRYVAGIRVIVASSWRAEIGAQLRELGYRDEEILL